MNTWTFEENRGTTERWMTVFRVFSMLMMNFQIARVCLRKKIKWWGARKMKIYIAPLKNPFPCKRRVSLGKGKKLWDAFNETDPMRKTHSFLNKRLINPTMDSDIGVMIQLWITSFLSKPQKFNFSSPMDKYIHITTVDRSNAQTSSMNCY